MAGAAAFFDLDRTILKGASGPVITEALVHAGIAPNRSLPGQGLLYKLFDVVGEIMKYETGSGPDISNPTVARWIVDRAKLLGEQTRLLRTSKGIEGSIATLNHLLDLIALYPDQTPHGLDVTTAVPGAEGILLETRRGSTTR